METSPHPTHRLWQEEGVPLLELTLSLPGGDGIHPRIAAYYEALAKSLSDFCAETLFPRLRGAYAADSDPRKRYTHRRTVLRAECTEEVCGGCLSVLRRVTLRGAGGTVSRCFAEVFRLSDGALLPLSAFLSRRELRRYVRRRKHPRSALRHALRGGGFCLSGGELCLLTEAGRLSLGALPLREERYSCPRFLQGKPKPQKENRRRSGGRHSGGGE